MSDDTAGKPKFTFRDVTPDRTNVRYEIRITGRWFEIVRKVDGRRIGLFSDPNLALARCEELNKQFEEMTTDEPGKDG